MVSPSPNISPLPQFDLLIAQLKTLNQAIAETLPSLRQPNISLHLRAIKRPPQTHVDAPAASSSLQEVRAARQSLQALDSELKAFEDRESRLLNARSSPKTAENELLNSLRASTDDSSNHKESRTGDDRLNSTWPWPLEREDYLRYGRQLIMPEIGLSGQLKLKQTSVLVVGVGGLGCPAAAYLAAAGVGTLGLVDGDTVEVSNLHRQILHSTAKVGWTKVDSAMQSLEAINPLVTYKAHNTHLTPQNALSIFEQYHIILDCTDHPTSRYLISDAAVLLGKPLVSASALKTDGQLTTLNNPPAPPGDPKGGPCYRCIFPKPPPPESVISCGEGGILGPVVGAMGVLQALEAIKVIVGPPSAAPESATPPTASLLIFSAYSPQPFRSVRLRGRKAGCAACSAGASISRESLLSGSMDYVQFCGVAQPIDVLGKEERLTATQYADEIGKSHTAITDHDGLLVDVRERPQFDLCSLPGSVNVPYSEISSWRSAEEASGLRDQANDKRLIRFICRLGNDSQLAVQKTKELGLWGEHEQAKSVAHVDGGWRAWRRDVDGNWPDY